jgi:hypothetical protein
VVDSDHKSGQAALHKPNDDFQEWLLANFGRVRSHTYRFVRCIHEALERDGTNQSK